MGCYIIRGDITDAIRAFACVMWAVIASMWAVTGSMLTVTASMWDVTEAI